MNLSRSLVARLALVALASGLLTLGVVGCFNPFYPRIADTRAVTTPPPAPISPSGVLELFRWCWINRAISEYREIFTDDYSFQFSERDSAGNAFRDKPWRREDELAAAENIFTNGTATDPPATSITLDYTQSLIPVLDGRDGKAYPWHQQIRSQVLLRVNRGENGFEVKGAALFYVVRGDSAKLPEELVNRGFQPDSNRWYIERWVDETLQDQTPGAFTLLRAPLAPARATTEASFPPGAASTADLVRAPRAPAPATLDPYLEVSWGRIKATYRR